MITTGIITFHRYLLIFKETVCLLIRNDIKKEKNYHNKTNAVPLKFSIIIK